MGLSTGHRLPLAQAFSFDQNMPRAAHVAPVLGPQRENFGAPEQLTGKQLIGAGDLVLSRCCIYWLLPAAYCLVHAACNKSARSRSNRSWWQARNVAQAAEMQC
jgi:hypothetical protein